MLHRFYDKKHFTQLSCEYCSGGILEKNTSQMISVGPDLIGGHLITFIKSHNIGLYNMNAFIETLH